jgi:TPP-dependent pyruvate/acetoin dehydrogenase alpha subunit
MFAGRSRLPLLFLVQNQRTEVSLDMGTLHTDYGIPVISVDANDAIAAYRVTTEAAHHARIGRGATIIEAVFVSGTQSGVSSPEPLACLEAYMRRHGGWFSARRDAIVPRHSTVKSPRSFRCKTKRPQH